MSWDDHQGAVRMVIDKYVDVQAAIGNAQRVLDEARVMTHHAIGESQLESAQTMLAMTHRVDELLEEGKRFMEHAKMEAVRYMNGF